MFLFLEYASFIFAIVVADFIAIVAVRRCRCCSCDRCSFAWLIITIIIISHLFRLFVFHSIRLWLYLGELSHSLMGSQFLIIIFHFFSAIEHSHSIINFYSFEKLHSNVWNYELFAFAEFTFSKEFDVSIFSFVVWLSFQPSRFMSVFFFASLNSIASKVVFIFLCVNETTTNVCECVEEIEITRKKGNVIIVRCTAQTATYVYHLHWAVYIVCKTSP